jgi:putative SOS response-associated peptidase YedK
MCGRYASARKRIELLEEFSVQRDRVIEELEPDYNVAPTKPVYAVLSRRPRPQDDAAPGQRAAPDQQAGPGPQAGPGRRAGPDQPTGPDQPDAVRELRVVRWGLVPSWAKDISIGSRLINARSETLSEKPSFKRAFARRRCLLPADGYYEWLKPADGPGQATLADGPGRATPGQAPAGQAPAGQAPAGKTPAGKARPAKQPFYISRGDGGPLAFAGLYELWRDHRHPDGDPDAWLWTATIITTTAPDDLGRIHDRMPMVIDPGSWDDWLDPGHSDVEDLRGLLAPAVTGGLTSYPVSLTVNSVRNNGPELVEPIELSETQLAALGLADEGPGSGYATPLGAPADYARRRGGTSEAVSGSEPDTLF